MQVASFLLADSAQEVNGKLYVLGGGWNIIFVAAVPDQSIVHKQLSLVGILAVSWGEANEAISFEVNLVDEDGTQIIPEPLKGELTIGRPANLTAGAEQVVPLVMNFENLTFPKLGTYAFTFSSNEHELARATLHVQSAVR